ncbi:hypothetical protein EON66_02865 [archaeon]|nr:MAG: hypothetical protein EON66_02865 [archaeon]
MIRKEAYDAGALKLICERMGAFLWEEDLQIKACWALYAFAPDYAVEIGALGAIDNVTAAMLKNKTNHDLQVAAIKLLSLLTLEPTRANVRIAQLANAIMVVKTVIQSHTDDGTLQYRGINLCERLEPGSTASMPKVNLVRTASMRAEELVFKKRSVARIESMRNARGPTGSGLDADTIAANAAAIQEVDELAQHVEEEEDEERKSTGRRRSSVGALEGTHSDAMGSHSESAATTGGVQLSPAHGEASEEVVRKMYQSPVAVPDRGSPRVAASDSARSTGDEIKPLALGSAENGSARGSPRAGAAGSARREGAHEDLPGSVMQG